MQDSKQKHTADAMFLAFLFLVSTTIRIRVITAMTIAANVIDPIAEV